MLKNRMNIPLKPPNIDVIQKDNIEFKRNERNQLLQKTDKYILPDFPLTDEQKEEVKLYRQALRDYFDRDDVINWVFTFENQHPPDFPPKPEFMK